MRARIVAPGFIDCHTHDDQALLSQPDMGCKVSQGVTTVIAGNCGISLFPLGPDTPLRARTMARLDRAADSDEIESMSTLLAQALDDGALGMSTGAFYPPSRHASTAEITGVGRPLGGRGGLYVTHMRDEAAQVMESLDETFLIGRELGVPVVISHHKVHNRPNFGRSSETLALIRRTMQHPCVALDCYPCDAGSTAITSDRGMLEGRVLIASSVPYPERAGRELDDIAAEWGVRKEAAAQRLAPGYAADIVVFDAQAVIDRADHDQPTRPAAGIDAVLVNGRLTWSQGRHLGAHAGQVLTRDPAATARYARPVASDPLPSS